MTQITEKTFQHRKKSNANHGILFLACFITVVFLAIVLTNSEAHAVSDANVAESVADQYGKYFDETAFKILVTKEGAETRIDTDGDGVSDSRIIETGPYTVEQRHPYKNIFSTLTFTKRLGSGVKTATFQLNIKLKRYELTSLSFRRYRRMFADLSSMPGDDFEKIVIPEKAALPSSGSSAIPSSPGVENQDLCSLRQLSEPNQGTWIRLAKKIKLESFVGDPYSQKLIGADCKSPELNKKLKLAYAENLFSARQSPERFAACAIKISGVQGFASKIVSKNWSDYLGASRDRPVFSCSQNLALGKAAVFDESKASGQIMVSVSALAAANQETVNNAVFHEMLHRSGIADEAETEKIVECCANGFHENDPACRQLSGGIYSAIKTLKQRGQPRPQYIDQLKVEFKKLESSIEPNDCDASRLSPNCSEKLNAIISAATSKVALICEQGGGAVESCRNSSMLFKNSIDPQYFLRCLELEKSAIEGTCLLQGGIPSSGKYTVSLPRKPSIQTARAEQTRIIKISNSEMSGGRSSNQAANSSDVNVLSLDSQDRIAGNLIGEASEKSSLQSNSANLAVSDGTVTLAQMETRAGSPTDKDGMNADAAQSGGIVREVRRRADYVFNQSAVMPLANASAAKDTSHFSKEGDSETAMVQASIPFSTSNSQSAPTQQLGSSTSSGGQSGPQQVADDQQDPGMQNVKSGDRSDRVKVANGGSGRSSSGPRVIEKQLDRSVNNSDDDKTITRTVGEAGSSLRNDIVQTGQGGPANVAAVGSSKARGGGAAGAGASGGGGAAGLARNLAGNRGSNPSRGPAGEISAEIEPPKTPWRNAADVQKFILDAKVSIDVLMQQKWFTDRISALRIKIVDRGGYKGMNDASTTWNADMLRKAWLARKAKRK